MTLYDECPVGCSKQVTAMAVSLPRKRHLENHPLWYLIIGGGGKETIWHESIWDMGLLKGSESHIDLHTHLGLPNKPKSNELEWMFVQ